jgi:hypothetical protein
MAGGDTRGLAPERGPQPVTWVAMLGRTVCITGAVVVGSALVATATVTVGDVWARRSVGLWVLSLSQSLLVVGFIGMARRRATTVDTVAAMVLASIGLVAASSFAWGVEPASKEAIRLLPVQAMHAQLVVAAITIRKLRWSLLTIAATALGTIWLTSLGDKSLAGVKLDDCVLSVGYALTAMVLIRGLRRAAWDANRLAERIREVRAGVVAASSAQLADDEGRRVVHDRVLSALAAVEAGSDPHVVADACRGALQALTALNPTTSVSSLREAWDGQEDPRVVIGGEGWPMSPPPRVVTALRESAGEAIRNAGQHAGVDEVSVQLTTTPDGQAAVVIHDTGRGFDPDKVGGFGLSQSIVARMGDVGGAARIESAPGMGTTVRLLWPRRSSLRISPEAGVLAPYGRSRLYVRVTIPLGLAMIYIAIHQAPRAHLPSLSVALAFVVTGVLVGCAYYVGRVIKPSWWFVAGMALFNVTATSIALHLAPMDQLLSLQIWAVTGCSLIIGGVGLAGSPLQVAVVALAEVGAVIAFAAQDPNLGIFEPVGALLMPVAYAAAGFTVGALLRRGSRLVAVQEALTKAEMEEAGWVESAQAARRHYAGQLQANVAPFLEFCATDLPTSTPQLKVRAAGLAAQCRDLLALSDAMPALAREVVLAARNKGVRVAIRDSPSVSPVAWALLVSVLRHSAWTESATLIPARADASARVTVIPRLSGHAEAEIREDLEGQTIWTEHTDVTSSLILVSPEWGTSVSGAKDLGSST